MVRLRKYLSCFYCGKRTTIASHSRIREFLCTNCEAKNHLDEVGVLKFERDLALQTELADKAKSKSSSLRLTDVYKPKQNGEITDPPIVEITAPKQYAVTSRAASPADLPSSFTSSSDTIFCDTCLKNQRLFTASLAQYLPDDPSHPDYADLERKCYRFRNDLEKRYPQVCADCAGKVESRIRQAGYTAKTDHLRLMMEKSRSRRVSKRTTTLDLANMAGRSMWWGGLLLQTLWHLANVTRALQHQQQERQHSEGMYDPDEKKPLTVALVAHLGRGVTFLPKAETLIFWSILVGLLSVWWNPYFVQFNRGFTRHLVGFTQWYSFQGLIVFLRYLFRNVVAMQGGKAQSRQAQLSAHLVMATIMCFIYSLAKSSIKVDTSPLFGLGEKTVTPPLGQITPARKREEPKTLAEELTEALDAATPARIIPTPKQEPATRRNTSLSSTPRPPSTPFRASREASPFASANFRPRSQSSLRSDRGLDDPDAMDWSPIPVPARSIHRALQTPTPKVGPRSFGESPTQPNANAFWFKVPPAPVNPAQRLRNPPNVPFLRQKQETPAGEECGLSFQTRRADRDLRNQHQAAQEDRIDFQQPSFFAPERSDETNILADVFSSSFSLGVEPVDSDDGDTEVGEVPSLPHPSSPIPPKGSKFYELCIMAALFPTWVLVSLTAVPYRTELQLVCLALAGLIALQSVGGERSTSKAAGRVLSTLSVAELGVICWALGQVWGLEQPLADTVPWYGAGALGLMLGQQMWFHLMQ